MFSSRETDVIHSDQTLSFWKYSCKCFSEISWWSSYFRDRTSVRHSSRRTQVWTELTAYEAAEAQHVQTDGLCIHPQRSGTERRRRRKCWELLLEMEEGMRSGGKPGLCRDLLWAKCWASSSWRGRDAEQKWGLRARVRVFPGCFSCSRRDPKTPQNAKNKILEWSLNIRIGGWGL